MLALLIDAENLSPVHSTVIVSWARLHGNLAVIRLFGDFSRNRLADWLEFASARGLEVVSQPNGGARKNSTDIALTIGAMDLLNEGVIRTFVLASNDRDFIPLALRLRRSGRQVLVATEKLDSRIADVCHDVLELRREAAPAQVAPPLPPIVAAYRKVADGKQQIPLAALGSLLRKHEPAVVPAGAGKLRKVLRESGWFDETGEGSALTIVLRRRVA